LRFNPAKLLLDPYARAISGAVRFGPEVLGYPVGGDPRGWPASTVGTRVPWPTVSGELGEQVTAAW